MTPSTLDAIGHTPLIRLEGIYVKLECANPGGSVRDRIARLRLRVEHGYCVGRSAGANMVAALRVHEHGASVVTLWPDCANRYVSVGLQPPSSEQVRCPLREGCEHRTRELLRGSGDPE